MTPKAEARLMGALRDLYATMWWDNVACQTYPVNGNKADKAWRELEKAYAAAIRSNKRHSQLPQKDGQ